MQEEPRRKEHPPRRRAARSLRAQLPGRRWEGRWWIRTVSAVVGDVVHRAPLLGVVVQRLRPARPAAHHAAARAGARRRLRDGYGRVGRGRAGGDALSGFSRNAVGGETCLEAGVGLVLLLEEERLREEQARHGHKRHQDEERLRSRDAVRRSRGLVARGGRAGGVVPGGRPAQG